MDRVCDACEYPPKPIVDLCQVKVIHGHEVKKIKFKILGLDGVIQVFRSDFRQERKNEP